MAYSAVPTVATGDLWTAAQHNTYIRDNEAALYSAIPPIGVILLWSGSVGSIPAGWALCDGSSGTPDLRNRFVIGAGSTYSVGASGGATTKNISHTHTQGVTGAEAAHTHTQGNTGAEASHTHTQGNTGAEASHTHSVSGNTGTATGTATFDSGADGGAHVTADAAHYHAVSLTSGAGSSHAHTNPTTSAGSSHAHTNPTTSAGSSHTHTNPTTASGGSATQDIMPPYYALAYIMRIS